MSKYFYQESLQFFAHLPTTWLLPPPNDEDNPPPFGFCTIMANTKRKATIRMRNKKIEKVLI